jgi:hypothetical protein
VLAALSFVLFAALVAALLTHTFGLDDASEAWVGVALIGAGSLVLAGWAVVIRLGEPLEWAARAGGDLLLAGVGLLLVIAGIPTFGAGLL